MNIKNRSDATVIKSTNLSDETTENMPTEFSIESMLDSGVLINVTAWATREMGFPRGSVKIGVSFTLALWRLIHRIPPQLTFFQTMRGRGHDILWLAAWMLRKAEGLGQDYAMLLLPMPTSDVEDDMKLLRVQRVEQCGRLYVVVGMAEEFPL